MRGIRISLSLYFSYTRLSAKASSLGIKPSSSAASDRSQRMPWLRDMPLTKTNDAVFDFGLDGAVEEADQVGVGEPHLAVPVVGHGFGAIFSLLDPADPDRDEGQVKRPRQASAHSFADELGDAVRPVGQGGHLDRDRSVTEVSIVSHHVVGAGEDHPLDARQCRRVKHVGQSVEIGPDQLVPRGELVAVGREMDDRVNAVKMSDPILIENRTGPPR